LRSTLGTSTAVATDNYYTNANTLTVPSGEIWLPINLTVTKLGIGAGTNFTARLGYTRKFANSVSALPVEQVVAADSDLVLGYEWPGGTMIAQPGDNFGVYIYNGTYATNPALNFCLTYYRLEI